MCASRNNPTFFDLSLHGLRQTSHSRNKLEKIATKEQVGLKAKNMNFNLQIFKQI